MYNSEDYLNFNDLNVIENRIKELTNYLNNNQRATIPAFIKKQWLTNEFPYVQEISRIEKGVDNLGTEFYKKPEWITTREWIINEGKNLNAFSYNDINRWLFNLDLIENSKDDILNIWNGQSFIYWNEDSNYEWEE